LILGARKDLATGNFQKHLSLCNSFGQDFWDERPTSVVRVTKYAGSFGVVMISESEEIFNMTNLEIPGGPYCDIKILDTKWICAPLLKQWKAICDKSHRRGNRRNCLISPAVKYLKPSSPQYFIDTWLRCLSIASPNSHYITLSYVWGNVKNLTTTKATLSMLGKQGSLLDPDVVEQLPNTIKDAINMVEYLGERYLWVYALCIVQDDDRWKYHQINNMASIYANSHLTIIAADGDDANYGLRGLRGISKPRILDQKVHTLTSRLRVIEQPLVYDGKGRHNRWTFQENIFSTRRLRFQGQMVHWECDVDEWDEDKHQVKRNNNDIDNLRYLSAVFTISYPSISGYRELVQAYGNRELRYEEDSLFAFSGVTTVLSQVFLGGFYQVFQRCFLMLLYYGSHKVQCYGGYPE
jgi:Heterokaryon incompatibility protein (HET)